jgi:hypothetical protein
MQINVRFGGETRSFGDFRLNVRHYPCPTLPLKAVVGGGNELCAQVLGKGTGAAPSAHV